MKIFLAPKGNATQEVITETKNNPMNNIAFEKAQQLYNLCQNLEVATEIVNKVILPTIGSEYDVKMWKEVRSAMVEIDSINKFIKGKDGEPESWRKIEL